VSCAHEPAVIEVILAHPRVTSRLQRGERLCAEDPDVVALASETAPMRVGHFDEWLERKGLDVGLARVGGQFASLCCPAIFTRFRSGANQRGQRDPSPRPLSAGRRTVSRPHRRSTGVDSQTRRSQAATSAGCTSSSPATTSPSASAGPQRGRPRSQLRQRLRPAPQLPPVAGDGLPPGQAYGEGLVGRERSERTRLLWGLALHRRQRRMASESPTTQISPGAPPWTPVKRP